jgi:predicted nucleic-acid-binding protein
MRNQINTRLDRMSIIGLDTNVLLRYFVAPGGDLAEQGQHRIARELIDSDGSFEVCKSVLLELEWVLRGYYRYEREEIYRVMNWLTTQPHIAIENRDVVTICLANYHAGFDFADALHHATYGGCDWVASFDDRGFARRSERLNLSPPVHLPNWRQP